MGRKDDFESDDEEIAESEEYASEEYASEDLEQEGGEPEDDLEEPEDELDDDSSEEQEEGEKDEEEEHDTPILKNTCHMREVRADLIPGDLSTLVVPEKVVLKADRITRPVLHFYEMVVILGERIRIIEMGGEPLIDNIGSLTIPQIAYMELMAGMTPFKVKRYLPQGKVEIWDLDELKIVFNVEDPYYNPRGTIR